jgi:hypothetical protein
MRTSPLAVHVGVVEVDGKSAKETNVGQIAEIPPLQEKAREEVEGIRTTTRASWLKEVTRACTQGGIVIRR